MIADMERAVSDKIYPAGTVYIQVSACRRAGLEQFKITEKEGKIENKYAVVVPKVQAFPPYLVTTLNNSADRFMYRYVGSNINISMNDFKFFELGWHYDINEQKAVMRILQPMEDAIKDVESDISATEQFKAYMLDKMFAQYLYGFKHNDSKPKEKEPEGQMKMF